MVVSLAFIDIRMFSLLSLLESKNRDYDSPHYPWLHSLCAQCLRQHTCLRRSKIIFLC